MIEVKRASKGQAISYKSDDFLLIGYSPFSSMVAQDYSLVHIFGFDGTFLGRFADRLSTIPGFRSTRPIRWDQGTESSLL